MNEAHLHLILTHFPIVGVIFGIVLLLYGLWRRNDLLMRVSMVTFVVTALFAVSLYFTGEAAEEAVEGLPGVSESLIEAHEEAAIWAIVGAGVLALLSLGGLLSYRQKVPQWVGTILLIIALAAGGLIGWTANLGGQINHPEIRSTETTAAPAAADENEQESTHEE